ncbi:protein DETOXIFICATION 45, chloroplastic-like isoform X2 [Phragmites australis]|uniref:protein DETOXIFICATION 45, chloroplastic-like isoform X2 n=1 Tax=Phragmites australis TaxID=29695 RepID=UPI002D774B14|nr:protein DETOXIFICATION 45, chloroplastic-like isoform X2 [Phragmites australis]XP_062182326.1 protein DETOXIFICATION 45, chloroplastic-like isoform X2 [Phragmites australis]
MTHNYHALVSPHPALCWTRSTHTRSSASSPVWKKANNISTSYPSTKLGVGAFTRRRTIPVANGQSLPGYSATPDECNNGLKSSDGISVGAVKDAVIGLHSLGVRSELILLALPAVFGQAIDPLAQLLETAYIGRLGALELASAGIGVSIFNILSKIFNIPLLSIATSFVAEDISKNVSKHSSSGKLELSSVSSALILAAGIGIIEASALFLGSGLFLKLMGVSPASPMHKPAKLFISLRALGAPANVIMLAVQGIFRGFKDTKTPLLYIGLGNLSAVVLLPLLIYGFQLGITGAAISTVASQYIIAVLLLRSLSKRAVLLPPRMDQLDFSGYLKSGGMLLGRTLSILLTMTIGTSMAARQGPTAMAAHQICLQVWLAVSLLADALAVSAQALIASSYAILDYKRVQKIAMFVLQIGVISGLALAVGLYGSFGNIARLFTSDPEVLMVVKSCALFVCASQPVNALAFIFDGLHYGVSDFDYVAQATIVVGIMSSLVLLYAPSVFGLAGVWAGLTTLMGLRMAAGILRLLWKSGPWSFLHEEP